MVNRTEMIRIHMVEARTVRVMVKMINFDD